MSAWTALLYLYTALCSVSFVINLYLLYCPMAGPSSNLWAYVSCCLIHDCGCDVMTTPYACWVLHRILQLHQLHTVDWAVGALPQCSALLQTDPSHAARLGTGTIRRPAHKVNSTGRPCTMPLAP